jgi:spore maturation protein CgeB
MRNPFRLVFLGLSFTSSWGNGHATTYRALVQGLARLGHEIVFLERDVPWYAQNRDLVRAEGCRVVLYESLAELEADFGKLVRDADAVIVGSYVPDGAQVLEWVLETAQGLRLFYDIDTPITLAKLASGEPTYIARSSIARLDAYLSFSGGPTLSIIENELGAPVALPLYCSVDERSYTPQSDVATRDLGYLGTYSDDRQPVLERLLVQPARSHREGSFIVAGPCYPAGYAWPPNVERIEHVPPGQHPSFYASLRFTLNITRADMVRMGYSPSVRLFEAAACGTPIISDRWPGIERFFEPGKEILLADDSDQVLAYVRKLDEAERRLIGERARRRVLSQHTASHRALQLDRYLRELRAGRSALLRAISTHEVRPRTEADFGSSARGASPHSADA